MRIRLLGTPELTSPEGAVLPIRGRQSWAVLARVVLADRPVSRRLLAEELFPETVDPLGALRWCLASLRRSLGAEAMIGDPVRANLPPGCRVDALTMDEPGFDPTGAGALLEGSEPEVCGPAFETWLLVERARLQARVDARLRGDVLAALTEGQAETALRLARHEVQRQPLDEAAHVHLIRALVLSGRTDLAAAHVARVEEEFLRELGELPSPALRSAARSNLADPPMGVGLEAAVRMLLKSGAAALKVGAVDAGIDNLRRASVAAETAGALDLRAEALAELGTALIHSVRGQDDEGIIHLRQAEHLAVQGQNRVIACRAVQEQSYAEALAGRRPDAEKLVIRALDLSDGDPARLATTLAFSGLNLADWGRHAEAKQAFEAALAAAQSAGLGRRQAWCLGIGAWAHLRAGDVANARQWAMEGLEICASQDWLAFRPWCDAVLAEARLLAGDEPKLLWRGMEAALALSCQLGDPCWEAANARVIGLSLDRQGKRHEALDWLQRASQALSRVTDPYAALQLRILHDQTRLTLVQDPERGRALLRHFLVSAVRLHGDAELDAALALRARRPDA